VKREGSIRSEDTNTEDPIAIENNEVEPINSPDTIKIREEGDLLIIAGPEKIKYKVSSNALQLASPVWKRMITANKNHPRIPLLFSNVSANLLLLVLYVSHMRFDKLPKDLQFQDLVDLAFICTEYDVLALVRPWLAGWVEPWKANLTIPGYEQWLYIAWAFGYEVEFVRQEEVVIA
jgi:hypothetical protein